VALAAGVPEDRAPVVHVREQEAVPVTHNDSKLAERMRAAFAAVLGAANVTELRPEMASEDFGLLGLEGRQIPTFMARLGVADPRQLAESRRAGKPMPSLHSSIFYPQAEPSLRTGVVALTAAVLDLLRK
jgi:hippurate hydrolase